MIHELKTWPEYFHPVRIGLKRFEVRKNDRNFKVGDVLILKEYSPNSGYTGEQLRVWVTFKMKGSQFGIDPDYCVLGITT